MYNIKFLKRRYKWKYVLVQNIISYSLSIWKSDRIPKPLKWKETKPLQLNGNTVISTERSTMSSSNARYTTSSTNEPLTAHINNEEWDDFDNSTLLSSPLLRNNFNRSRSSTPLHLNANGAALKSGCLARTRSGTPCKLSAVPGRDFCHRHRVGSSVMGS